MATKIQRRVIKSPRDLCLYGNYKETKAFFDLIEGSVLVGQRYVLLDFSPIQEMTAAAALYLFSTITICQNCAPKQILYPSQVINYKFPSAGLKRSLFTDTGLWGVIRPGGESKLNKIWDEKEGPFQTGNNPEKQYPEMLAWFNTLGFGGVPKKLSSAVQEAYLNIKQHAYDSNAESNFVKGRWWQYAYHKKDTNQVVFFILDRGQGIPNNVGNSIFDIEQDSKKIEKAMTEGWSSTGRPGRGRGSANIQKPVNVIQNDDTLLIMSGKGYYLYRNDTVEKKKVLDLNLSGTLIEWALSV